MRLCATNLVFPACAVVTDLSGHEVDRTILTLVTHGFTGIVIWVEIFWIPHKYCNWKLEAGIAGLYAIVYLIWNVICYTQNDVWAYESLQVRMLDRGHHEEILVAE